MLGRVEVSLDFSLLKCHTLRSSFTAEMSVCLCAVAMKNEALQRENERLRLENQWFRRVFENS